MGRRSTVCNFFPDDRPKCIDVGQLLPGDILLLHSKDDTGRTVQRVTGDRYTHASIYLGQGEVAEANLGGVMKIPLEIPKAGHIAVFRHQCPLSDKTAQTLRQFVDEMIAAGAEYDHEAKNRSWVKALRERQKDFEVNWHEKLEQYFAMSEAERSPQLNRFVCSAFVATCYFQIGLLDGSMSGTLANPEAVLPQDLGGQHFLFGHIFGYLAPSGYAIPEDDPFCNRSSWASQGFGD
jgi:hypothetical protein